MTLFNPDLINDLAERRAVLFVGAGVSAGVITQGGVRLKVWKDFLKEHAAIIEDPTLKQHALNLIEQQDYLMACEMISRAIGSAAWEEVLINEYNQRAEPSELQNLIMRLRQRIVITTNFDMFLEKAWHDANPESTHNPRVLRSIDAKAFQAFRDTREYLIKLHGSIDTIESIIFTKKEYTDKAYGNWAYSKFIETVLMTHTVIFIGFSLADPAISQVIETYAHNLPEARPHYIFLPSPQSELFVQINKELRRIFIIPYDYTPDHGELTTLFGDLVSQVEKRRREINIAALRKGFEEGLHESFGADAGVSS